eukprot:scaffold37599_cov26-Prasinocladus_malaysianus.AAC.1
MEYDENFRVVVDLSRGDNVRGMIAPPPKPSRFCTSIIQTYGTDLVVACNLRVSTRSSFSYGVPSRHSGESRRLDDLPCARRFRSL